MILKTDTTMPPPTSKPSPTPGLTSPTARTIEIPAVQARLTYFLTPAPYATMQILDMVVAPPHRRKGHGSSLLESAIKEAKSLLKETKLRRVYVAVPQKTAIEFRAFLTHAGFHHVSTTSGLLKNEDLLTYIKSYT